MVSWPPGGNRPPKSGVFPPPVGNSTPRLNLLIALRLLRAGEGQLKEKQYVAQMEMRNWPRDAPKSLKERQKLGVHVEIFNTRHRSRNIMTQFSATVSWKEIKTKKKSERNVNVPGKLGKKC